MEGRRNLPRSDSRNSGPIPLLHTEGRGHKEWLHDRTAVVATPPAAEKAVVVFIYTSVEMPNGTNKTKMNVTKPTK